MGVIPVKRLRFAKGGPDRRIRQLSQSPPAASANWRVPDRPVDMQLSRVFSHGTTAHDEERLIPLVLD